MIAAAVRATIAPNALGTVTMVPIPPSKAKTDPEYDPRMAIIAKTVVPDTRESIETVCSRQPLHLSDQRMRPEELFATLRLQEVPGSQEPTEIILLDDVITTGCSFVACHRLLRDRYPTVLISGIFAARRVIDRENPFADLGC